MSDFLQDPVGLAGRPVKSMLVRPPTSMWGEATRLRKKKRWSKARYSSIRGENAAEHKTIRRAQLDQTRGPASRIP